MLGAPFRYHAELLELSLQLAANYAPQADHAASQQQEAARLWNALAAVFGYGNVVKREVSRIVAESKLQRIAAGSGHLERKLRPVCARVRIAQAEPPCGSTVNGVPRSLIIPDVPEVYVALAASLEERKGWVYSPRGHLQYSPSEHLSRRTCEEFGIHRKSVQILRSRKTSDNGPVLVGQ